jgi:hypothetical protein
MPVFVIPSLDNHKKQNTAKFSGFDSSVNCSDFAIYFVPLTGATGVIGVDCTTPFTAK